LRVHYTGWDFVIRTKWRPIGLKRSHIIIRRWNFLPLLNKRPNGHERYIIYPLSDIYFSIGSGIAALNGSLHGGANEKVMNMLEQIGRVEFVKPRYGDARRGNHKVMGFGHRVYNAYDPRARVLGPLAELLVQEHPQMRSLFDVARALEREVVSTLGKEKRIFPNVDFYSGLVYRSMGIDSEMFTPIFAMARVA